MNNLVFGKYIPIDSLMHKLDPRAKLIGLFLMIAAVSVLDRAIVISPFFLYLA